jgi:thiamine-monophosphate kinase
MQDVKRIEIENLLKNSLFSSTMLLNLINDLLDLAKIENSSEFQELLTLAADLGLDIWKWIFAGGEDHALLATGRDLPGILIGEVVDGAGLQGLPEGVESSAWKHFK